MEDITTGPQTHFAPPERMSSNRLTALSERILKEPIVTTILESVGGMVLILNAFRQVVAGNEMVMEALENMEREVSVLGTRPGEAFGCVHAQEGPGGCGTSVSCRHCGAVLAIMGVLDDGEARDGECYMTVKRGGKLESREFKVRATRLTLSECDPKAEGDGVEGHGGVGGVESFVVFVLQDISDAKRRHALERVFLHDLANTLTGLLGWGEILRVETGDKNADNIVSLSQILTQEVQAQQLLSRAERGALKLKPEKRTVAETFEALETVFRHHPVAAGKGLAFDGRGEVGIYTDHRLLVRILVNMLKNALEATQEGGDVAVTFQLEGERGEGDGGEGDRGEGGVYGGVFMVRNKGVMTEATQRQIFTRSFSTKAEPGRGLGTYSMRLFGEEYLGGKVEFESSLEEGTLFRCHLPHDVVIV